MSTNQADLRRYTSVPGRIATIQARGRAAVEAQGGLSP